MESMNDDGVCSFCLSATETHRKGPRRTPSTVKTGPDSVLLTIQKNLSIPEDERVLCLACDVDASSIQCDGCQHWFHMRCVGLTPAKAERYDRWICPRCSLPADDRIIEKRAPLVPNSDLMLHSAGVPNEDTAQ